MTSRTRCSTDPGSWCWPATCTGASASASHGTTPGAREPGVGPAVPGHGGALGVAALVVGPEAQPHRVQELVLGDVAVGQPDLVALVEHGRAPQGEEHEQRQADLGGVAAAPPGGQARHVVVRARPHRPRRRGEQGQGALHHVGQCPRLEGGLDEGEVESQVQLVVPRAVVRGEVLQGVDVGLPQQEPRRAVAVGDGPPPAQDVVGLGTVAVVDRTLAEHLHDEGVVLGGGRVVAQRRVLHHHVADVDAEAGHAAVPPEAHDVVEGVCGRSSHHQLRSGCSGRKLCR